MNPPAPAPGSPAPAPAELNAPAWQMLARSAAATALVDLGGKIVYVNAAFLALWGFDNADEVLGRASDEIFCTCPTEARAVREAVAGQHAWNGELKARRADGAEMPVWCESHIVYGGDGRPASMMLSFIDRSAEVAARAALDGERRFVEAVIGSAGMLVLVIDERGRIVRFNAEAERLSGWRAAEVLGRCPWETWQPAGIGPQAGRAAFDAAIATFAPGDVRHHTSEWQARDGRRRLIDWTDTMLVDGAGPARFVVSVGTDVTERRVAEDTLRRSEEQLRQAQSVANIGSWELDLVAGTLYWTEQVFALFEIDPTRFEASYSAFLARVHPEDRAAVDAAYARALERREPYAIEHRLLMPDGRVKWVEEHGLSRYDAQGEALRTIGTVQDVTERHRRDAELHRFRHMVEQTSQEIWLTDEDQRIRYANRAAAASLGYSPEQLMGLSLADVDAAGGAFVEQTRRRLAEDVASGRAPGPYEVVHRARDGRLVPKEIRPTLLRIDGQRFGCAFAQDITERQRMQAALVAAEASLRATLDAFPGWVACVDDELRYLYANETLCRRLGRPRDAVVGRTLGEMRGAAVADELREFNRRLLRERQVQMERRYVEADGDERIYWVHYRVENDASAPGRHLFYAFGTDITESRRALLRLNTLVESVGIGLWEWNAQTDALQFNPQLPLLLGDTPGAPPADPRDWYRTHLQPQDRAARKAQLLRVLAGESRIFESELRARHRNGQWIWLLERGRVVSVADDGSPLVLIGTMQDITALKSHEEALQRLNEDLEGRVQHRTQELAAAKAEAERASAAKTDFLSRMSHELRTPMNAIIGFSQLLELSSLPGEDAEHVDEIMRAGRHLLDLINEVLDLATVESGRIELAPQSVSLGALVDECVALMKPAAQQADLRLHSHVEPNCRPVSADRGRLKQVLLNLLSNAVKYNQRGGRVTVDCDCSTAGICEVGVSDTGPGLTPTQIERLFQPFERLDAARGAVQGTGIGLSVSKRLVELMGGEIGVHSDAGQGSRFWLRLPTLPQTADGVRPVPKPEIPAPARVAAPGALIPVLYVEDNLPNQRLMRRILGRRGDIALVCGDDGLAAVALARQVQPALILLDIQLPGLDGYELLARLRAEGIDVPVVAVSANAMPSDIERGRGAGFAEYLTKPLDVQRVLDAMESLLVAPPSGTGAGRSS